MKKYFVVGIQLFLFIVFLSAPAFAVDILDASTCDYKCCDLDKCAGCPSVNPLNCDPGRFASCLAKQNDCKVKLPLFNAYFAQMSYNVPLYTLSANDRAVLAQYYPAIDLSTWKFGFSNRQQANNATTDCDRTYFNDSNFVTNLSQGRGIASRMSDVGGKIAPWAFHEISHYVQCQNVGGRGKYAKMWFDNFLKSAWGSLDPRRINLQDLSPIFTLFHDSMPMEQDAQNIASPIWVQIASCCTDNSRNIFPPLQINTSVNITPVEALLSLRSTIYPGKTVNIQAAAAGGAASLTYNWSIQLPGSAYFTGIPSIEGTTSGATFTWTPRAVGSYRIKLSVTQNNTNINPVEKILNFSVIAKPALIIKPSF